jgi:hypothetical protein
MCVFAMLLLVITNIASRRIAIMHCFSFHSFWYFTCVIFFHFKVRSVLSSLVEFGAPERILVDSKPHLGTDRMVTILISRPL